MTARRGTARAVPLFHEDELQLPFTGTMAWTKDGRGAEVCAAAQMMRIPLTAGAHDDDSGGKVRLVDKIIWLRYDRTGVRFTKQLCRHCNGWHLHRET